MANGVWLWRFGGWLAVVAAAAGLAVGAGCSSDGAGDGADAVALDTTLPDTAAQALGEAECAAKNGECVKATWTPAGACEVTVKSGGWCGNGASVCSGTCSAAGTCVGPGPETHCGSTSEPCSLCDGKGGCAVNRIGAECTPSAVEGDCFQQTGTCDATGTCKLAVLAGAACQSDSGPCGAGVCNAAGVCVNSSVGKACSGTNGFCRKSDGTCDAYGNCIGAADIGASCFAGPSSCSAGFCNADAVCVPTYAPIACTTTEKQICRKLIGVCGTNGSCVGDIDVGAVCPSKSVPCGGICNSEGECISGPALVGATCTVESGPCAGKPGICSTGGYCLGVDECAKPYIAVPTGDFAKGLSCIKMVGNIPAMPPANSGTCGNDGDPCKPKFCKTLDSDATFTCKVGQLNDGTPCPGDAGNPCAASTCQAGKCIAAFKPVGTSCKPLAPTLCAEFQCSSAGKCEPVPASVPLAAPCTVSDGDTDCWAKFCDGQGKCTKVPRAKGEHCGAELDNACAKFACDGKGRCLVDLLAVNGQCKDAKCLDFYAKPGTPCTGGPCTDNGCTSLGICATSYKAVGAPCEVFGYPGTCDESHVCIWPAKVMGGIAGSSCYGTFPCMKEDVAYGADGVCHGTVAVGAACGSLCNPGICGADGSCKQAFGPKGVACGWTELCGAKVCDGKGGCGFPEAGAGKACNGGTPGACSKFGCDSQGKCVEIPIPGKACPTGDDCEVGVCDEKGVCVETKLTGTACTMKPAIECKKGLCNNGLCTAIPNPGKACGKDTACMAYSCNGAGQCAGTPKPGASCESTEMCKVGVCDAAGQCKQVLAPGAKCGNPKQCMEGTCDASGGCEFAPMPSGSQCTAAAPGTDWSCYTGACDGKGGCGLKINAGAKCKKGAGPCTEGICQSDASCKTVPANLGADCSTTCIPAGVCDAQGSCSGQAATGKFCNAQCIYDGKCGEDGKCVGPVATGGSCGGSYDPDGRCVAAACKSDGSCVADVFAPAGKTCWRGIATVVSGASYYCGSWGGTCDGKGGCTPASIDPDGAPCGAADDMCATARVCKGGECVPIEPKADLTPCNYGCGQGFCNAGACDTGWYGAFDMPAPMPCADGDPCTDDFCGGGALPHWPLSLYWAPPGKCGHVEKNSCIDGKPPVEYNYCKNSDCGKDGCGYQKWCHFEFGDKVGNCWFNYNQLETFGWESQSKCDDKSPCTLDGCSYGSCVHQPINEGTNCAPFKQCQEGKCVPWN